MKFTLICYALLLLCSGCTTIQPYQERELLRNGISTELEENKISEFQERQKRVYTALQQLAADPGRTPTAQRMHSSNQWPQIVNAGFMYVDRECHAYMTLLHRFNQSKKEIGGYMNLVTTSAAAIQGVLGETARTVSLTGAGLGLLESAWSNYGSTLLFELEPSAVNELVDKMKSAFRESPKLKLDDIDDRATAFSTIYGYAELCTPIKISREVTNAIAAAKPATASSGNNSGDSNQGASVPSVTVVPERKMQETD